MTTTSKDYYTLLGVPRNAEEKDIRSAYRRLARKYHPDLHPSDKTAEQHFKEIGEAYEVLSDPEKRKLYDRFGANWQQAQRMQQQGIPYEQAYAQEPTAGRGRRQSTFDGFGGGQDVGDLFEGLFRTGGVGGTGPAAPLEVEVQITLEEAYIGTKRLLEMPSRTVCAQCNGTGRVTSAGRGPAKVCAVCGGQGQGMRQVRAEAEIPPGVDTGARIRITPHGQQVLLNVTVLPHARFRREGSNLHSQVQVPLYTTLLGGEVTVPTLRKQVSLTIPADTQNGQTFRLAGQGMPYLGDANRKGDLLVSVQVVLPTSLSPKERELFERLRGMQRNG
ncbi:MAG: J domain-containing protein [Dehalococcoidia bacterium]|nr:J domain-containing protein [Dehalococcoidia bacterium]